MQPYSHIPAHEACVTNFVANPSVASVSRAEATALAFELAWRVAHWMSGLTASRAPYAIERAPIGFAWTAKPRPGALAVRWCRAGQVPLLALRPLVEAFGEARDLRPIVGDDVLRMGQTVAQIFEMARQTLRLAPALTA